MGAAHESELSLKTQATVNSGDGIQRNSEEMRHIAHGIKSDGYGSAVAFDYTFQQLEYLVRAFSAFGKSLEGGKGFSRRWDRLRSWLTHASQFFHLKASRAI